MTINTLTATSLADLKATATSNPSVVYDRSLWAWTTGDFTGRADNVEIVEANGVVLSIGAWVRQTNVFNVMHFGALGDGVTNDAPAVQAAINAARTLGGTVFFPPQRTYLFTSQVLVYRTFASTPGGYVGQHPLVISGYGAEIKASGSISALSIYEGWPPNLNVVVEGLTFNFKESPLLQAGINIAAAPYVTLRDLTFYVDGNLLPGFACIYLHQGDPTNLDTGCFWNVIERCNIRPWSGSDGACTFGVLSRGHNNALTIRDCSFNGSLTHIYVGPDVGPTPPEGPYPYYNVLNSLHIENNFFEGPLTNGDGAPTCNAIELNSNNPTYHVPAVRIISNRFETINQAVVLSGTASDVQTPLYLVGNYGLASVTTYIHNPNNVPFVTLDPELIEMAVGPFRLHNKAGTVLSNVDGAYDALTLKAANTGKGMQFQDNAGLALASWTQATGIGTRLAGVASTLQFLKLAGVGGISGTDTDAHNLGGTTAFAGSGTVTITFTFPEADADFRIQLTGDANETFWVTGKSTTGCVLHSSNAASTAQVDWQLYRA